MGKWLIAAAGVLAGVADAPARSALVAAGRCDDPELIEQSRALEQLLADRMGGQLFERGELTRRLPAPASRAPDALERQLEGAEQQYFEARYAAAEQRVREALAEVERLDPGPGRWRLHVRGLLLRALVLKARNRPREAVAQFRRVLRLAPDHRLDSDYFPPSARAGFDRMRRQLLWEPRAALTVTSAPAGGEIFIDGLDVRRSTPATLELVAGRYSIAVSKDGRFSFPRTLELTSSSSLHFDLDFEGSFRPALVPCFEDAGEERFRLKNAVNLGSWLGAEQVVLVSSDRRSTGDAWVSAAQVQVASGRKVREGRIRADSSETGTEALGELAELIISGKAGRNVVVSDVAPPSPPPEPALAHASLEPAANLPVPEPVRVAAGPRGGSKRWPALAGASLLGLGALAVGGGVLFQIRSDQSWASLDRRYADGTAPPITELPAVQSIRRNAESQRRAALVSYALGAAAICSGALLVLSRPAGPDRSPNASILAVPGAVSVAGSWP